MNSNLKHFVMVAAVVASAALAGCASLQASNEEGTSDYGSYQNDALKQMHDSSQGA